MKKKQMLSAAEADIRALDMVGQAIALLAVDAASRQRWGMPGAREAHAQWYAGMHPERRLLLDTYHATVDACLLEDNQLVGGGA